MSRMVGLRADELAHAAVCIQRRERLFWVRIVASLSAGAVLSFAGPAMLASAVVAATYARANISWSVVFWFASAGIIPILYVIELRTAGEFYMRELRAQQAGEDGRFDWQGLWNNAWSVRRESAEFATWIEILLFAPRLTLGALRQLKVKGRICQPDYDRAAALVAQLKRRDGGVAVEELLRDDKRPEDFWELLAYLRFHDWVDVSKDGGKVWILTEARRRLE